MIHLYLAGKEAALPPDFSATLNLQNDFLNDRSDDATYPFSLSVSANRGIFGYPDRLQNNNYKTTFTASLLVGPYLLIEGTAYIENIDGDTVECYITAGAKGFWEQAATITLNDKDNGPKYAGGTWSNATARRTLTERWGNCVFAPLYDYAGETLINAYEVNIESPHTRPFLRVLYLLEFYITTRMGYTITRNDLRTGFEWFGDLLLVYAGQYALSNLYALPDLSLADFIIELENRFAVRFTVDNHNKNVDIISFDNTIKTNDIGENSCLLAYDNPQRNFRARDEYNKRYFFADKAREGETVDKIACCYPFFVTPPEGDGLTEFISSQVGSQNIQAGGAFHRVAAIEKTTPEETTPDFYLGVYQGITGDYPVMNAVGLQCARIYSYHENLIRYLNRTNTVSFNIHPETCGILSTTASLFKRPVVVNYKTYLPVSAEITLDASGITEFTLECAAL